MNDGLIKGVIIQSGVSMMFGDEDKSIAEIPSLWEAEKYGADFLCTIGIDSLEKAKQTDAYELMKRLDKAQQHGSRRVVGTADSVAAHTFKLLQPSLPTLPISHSACQAAVVVDAHALYFHSLTV